MGDVSGARILMIHGLSSKPPATDLHRFWTRRLVENIRIDDRRLAAALEAQPETFVSAYWANATPHHIEDDAPYVRKLSGRIDQVIAERRKIKDRFHVGPGEAVEAFFRNRGADVVKLLAGALTVKDDVMKGFLHETRLYAEDQYIADRMRRPLEEALREAWDQGRRVAIVSHSMGSFIAYDVLWRFSHRSEPEFRRYRRRRVAMLVTMGSPLGEGAVRDLLFARHHGKRGRREFPINIDFWHNYACLGDVVSHQHDFAQTFYEPMRKQRLFPRKPAHRTIDYANLHNPFVVVEHAGNRHREKRNPHKSYGYLVQPRLGTWLADFLRDRLV